MNNDKKEIEAVYNYYKDTYRVDWVPNEDFSYEGDSKYYEECPHLIIYFSKKKEYAILADIDEVDLLKKEVKFKKEKWVSIAHNHPSDEPTEDGKEVIRAIDHLISKAI